MCSPLAWMQDRLVSLLQRIDEGLGDALLEAEGAYLPNYASRIWAIILFWFRHFFQLMLYCWRSRFCLVDGVIPCPAGGGEHFSILYVSEARLFRGPGCCDLCDMIYAPGEPSYQWLESCFAWETPRRILELAPKVDLVVMERSRLVRWLPENGSWVIYPSTVRMQLEFIPGERWEEVEHRLRGNKYNINLFRNRQFQVRVTRNNQDFQAFYETMYLPTVAVRHGKHPWVSSRERLLRVFQKGVLLQLLDGTGRAVSGILLRIYGGTVLTEVNGVLNGDRALLKKGAMSGLYYAVIRWCYDNGFQKLDMGEVRPFLNDGLYTHKLNWGMQPVQDPLDLQEWVFWSPDESKAASPVAQQAIAHLLPNFVRSASDQQGEGVMSPDVVATR